MIQSFKLTTENSCIAIAVKDGQKWPVVVIEPFWIYRIYPDEPAENKTGFMKKFDGFLCDIPETFDDFDDVHAPIDGEWKEVYESLRKEIWGT